MSDASLMQYVDAALASLKDFQQSTVSAAYSQLYRNDQRCMLIADEVGLGKTIVARGIIARRIKHRIDQGIQEPLRVTYICSNQVIARENIRKLNLFPASVQMKKPVSRLAFLALNEEDQTAQGITCQNFLELNSLTPATSFEVKRSTGVRDERAIIYGLLCSYKRMQRRSNGLRWMLKGGVVNMDAHHNYMRKACHWDYRKGLAREYKNALKAEPFPRKGNSAVYDNLSRKRELNLWGAVVNFAKEVDGRTEKRLHRGCLKLIYELRRVLVDCCLKYVNADIYILDEFQRFRDLIDRDSEQEQSVIARKVFSAKHSSRILLLSATPFKAFTSHDDLDRGEDHHKDFRKVLEFLVDGNQQRLASYDLHRQGLYKQLLGLRKNEINASSEHRDKLQSILRTVICRTERNSVADDPTVMIDDQRQPLPVTMGDIENFRQTDQIAMALNQLEQNGGKPVEYCKSAAFPLSYLDHYQFKELTRDYRDSPILREALDSARNAWLNLNTIDDYSANFSADDNRANGALVTHAKLRAVIEKAFSHGGAELLWVPPSLLYYQLEGSYQGSERFSKTLLFSSWVMAPRMISTLLSYEAERRTVGQDATRERAEREPRRYFAGERRRPAPRLVYAREGREQNHRPRNMSNFTLLYPGLTLAGIMNPVTNIHEDISLQELKQKVARQLQQKINTAQLAQHETPGGDSERWYWAAAMLLDRADPEHKSVLDSWFDELYGGAPWYRSVNFWKDTSGSAKDDHFAHLRQAYYDPASIGLGSIPDNLAEVLADLALGAPAVLTLRSVQRMFPAHNIDEAMVGAFDVADKFVSLFNKPESIAAVRLGTARGSYWRMVARYCANGCLQAVLDEYFHVLKGQNVDAYGALDQLYESVNLDQTATLNVDSLESFRAGEPRAMRCHYAVEFGSQRIETDQGGKRASSLREVFNSPFRPFVLATTSIGQEGLDFHSYCRRIVHWNLPGNPIDLEQREGRINRYKGLVIRQIVAEQYRSHLGNVPEFAGSDVWESLFELADKHERRAKGKCELTPYWHMETTGIKIERVIPLYPYSSDSAKLKKILKTLAVYRLAFGQPRQAELVDHLLHHDFSPEELKQIVDNLMIDLSPINYAPENGEAKPS